MVGSPPISDDISHMRKVAHGHLGARSIDQPRGELIAGVFESGSLARSPSALVPLGASKKANGSETPEDQVPLHFHKR